MFDTSENNNMTQFNTIVGGILGGFICLALISLMVFACASFHKRRKEKENVKKRNLRDMDIVRVDPSSLLIPKPHNVSSSTILFGQNCSYSDGDLSEDSFDNEDQIFNENFPQSEIDFQPDQVLSSFSGCDGDRNASPDSPLPTIFEVFRQENYEEQHTGDNDDNLAKLGKWPSPNVEYQKVRGGSTSVAVGVMTGDLMEELTMRFEQRNNKNKNNINNSNNNNSPKQSDNNNNNEGNYYNKNTISETRPIKKPTRPPPMPPSPSAKTSHTFVPQDMSKRPPMPLPRLSIRGRSPKKSFEKANPTPGGPNQNDGALEEVLTPRISGFSSDFSDQRHYLDVSSDGPHGYITNTSSTDHSVEPDEDTVEHEDEWPPDIILNDNDVPILQSKDREFSGEKEATIGIMVQHEIVLT